MAPTQKPTAKPAGGTKPAAKATAPATPAPKGKAAAAPAKAPAAAPAKSKAAAPKATPAPEYKHEIGATVVLKGYAQPPTDGSTPLFTEGQELVVVGHSASDKGKAMYDCVAADQYEAYQADNDAVEGEQLYGSEIKAKPKAKAVVEAAPVEVVSVGELDTIIGGNTDLTAVARGLIEDTQRSEFYLGGVLSMIYYNERYTETHPKDGSYTNADGKTITAWDKYLEDNFGFKSRKAQYLIDTYMGFAALPNFDPERLIEIGFSKAARIAPHVAAENVEELMAAAAENSVVQLEDLIRDKFHSAGGSGGDGGTRSRKIKTVQFGPFKLSEDAGEGVKTILEAAARQTNIKDPNDLFEHIVNEWAGDHLGEATVKKANAAKAKVAKANGTAAPAPAPKAKVKATA